MIEKKLDIKIFVTGRGKAPFQDWLRSLKDLKARAKVRQRIDRLTLGNAGDCESVGGGVYEIRIHFGPGYRVYFGRDGKSIILLLCGGSKKSQQKDIDKAKSYWQEYQQED